MSVENLREARLAVASGLSIHYAVHGERQAGTPILCLPGFWRNSRDFEDLAPRLAVSRPVITPDLRGRGLSDYAARAEDYAFELLVDDMWSLLDHLGARRAVILGVTLGGLIGMEMALQRPGRVAGLVLNDVGPEKAKAGVARLAGAAGPEAVPFAQAVARVRAQNESFHHGLSAADWETLTRRAYAPTPEGDYARDFDQLTNVATGALLRERPHFWSEWTRLGQLPIAVLRGQFSDFLDEEILTRMVDLRPDVLVARIPGRGHPPLLDEAESLKAIDAILAKADAAVGRGDEG